MLGVVPADDVGHVEPQTMQAGKDPAPLDLLGIAIVKVRSDGIAPPSGEMPSSGGTRWWKFIMDCDACCSGPPTWQERGCNSGTVLVLLARSGSLVRKWLIRPDRRVRQGRQAAGLHRGCWWAARSHPSLLPHNREPRPPASPPSPC
jgi:hypothetical protein